MVRNYRKKGDGPKWTKEDMGKAIDDVKNKKMSIYAAAKVNGVPKTTLLRHLKHPNKTFIVGRPTTLTSAQEDEIVETCQIFAEWGFGKTSTISEEKTTATTDGKSQSSKTRVSESLVL